MIEFPLVGPGGEPVDLWRTMYSHGIASLPPMSIDEKARTLTVTIAIPGGVPRTVTISSGTDRGIVTVHGAEPSESERAVIRAAVLHLLRFDQDLSPFYRLAADDPALSWVQSGAGRMTRCATVFEDVVKTICTTNCNWAATKKMVAALVQQLGEPATDAPADSPGGRAFPTPEAMAAKDETFYREIIRCGYRAPHMVKLSRAVASGELDLERFGRATPVELSDDDLAKQLLALPGIGPYAAAHVMTMLGRYSRLILDSWTRPTYCRLLGTEGTPDQEIVARFARYGDYAGLAFWLFVTHDWVEENASPSSLAADVTTNP
jgi:N-glycosylase/DNA lyase